MTDKLTIAVTFDQAKGYVTTGSELRSPLTALSLTAAPPLVCLTPDGKEEPCSQTISHNP
jgi:hypothetical protein